MASGAAGSFDSRSAFLKSDRCYVEDVPSDCRLSLRRVAPRWPSRCAAFASPPRKVCFWGYLGTGNLGNDASYVSLSNWFSARHPEVEICISTSDPSKAHELFGVEALALMGGRRFRGTPRRAGVRFLERLYDCGVALKGAPGGADAIIIPGMGILESSMTESPWGLTLLLALTSVSATLRQKPLILVGIGAESRHSMIALILHRITLALTSYVSGRDDTSFGALQCLANGRLEPQRTCDIVFGLDAPVGTHAIQDRVVVGILAAEESLGRRGCHYESEIVLLVARLLDEGREVILVGGDKVDFACFTNIRALLAAHPGQSRLSFREVDTLAQLIGLMSSAELIIASRYHNLVAAVISCRPVISIGYAPKCRDLLRSVGLGEFAFDIESFKTSDILVSAARQVNGWTARRDLLVNSLRAMQIEVQREFQRVESALGLSEGDYA